MAGELAHAHKWPWVTLGELGNPVGRAFVSGPFGSNIGSRFFVDAGIPVIRGNNLTTDDRKFVDDGFVYVTSEKAAELGNVDAIQDDLIFTAAGSIGQVGIIPKKTRFPKYIISNKQIRVRLNHDLIDPLFAYYWLSSASVISHIQQQNTGSSVPLINLSIVRSLPVPLPSLPEQKAISHILGTLDDKIELNRRMNATLEAIAQALFQSWFVNFDPVRAKSESREPAGLDEATAALFPAEFQDSPIGPIPLGWRTVSLSDVCEVNGWTLGKNDILETLEYIEISEVDRGNVSNMTVYARGDEPGRARRRLRHGDTVLSTVRPDRRAYFLALNPPDNRVASTGFAVLSPTKAPWSFVHCAITQDEVFEHLGHVADGGAYPAVRPEIISAHRVLLPPDDQLLTVFHELCGPFFERAELNREESRNLAEVRDALLPKLLSGELPVVSVEKMEAQSQ